MASVPPLNADLHNRLSRFLYTGMEVPKYFPGFWPPKKYFVQDKLTAINECFEYDKQDVETINIIVKAFNDGIYSRYETIAFALTKCLLLGGPAVKEAGYKAVQQVCITPEQLMLYSKYTKTMRSGGGQGWCKSVQAWYGSRDPMALAREVTRVRARYGRSHKALIRKSHVKIQATDTARHAVIKYAMYGLKKARQLMEDAEGTQEIFDYIQKVEDMRHCEDPLAAAAIASQNQFTLDHVPAHLLTSQEVWEAVLPQLTLSQLLSCLLRIHNMGFFAEGSTTTAVVLSMLNDPELIKNSKVTPIEVYITLCNYKMKSRPMKPKKRGVWLEKQQKRRARQVQDAATGQWQWATKRRHPKEIKIWGIERPPSKDIIEALEQLIDKTWTLTPPTGKRYLITMDMRDHMFKGRHFCKKIPKKVHKSAKRRRTNAGTAAAPAAREPAAAAASASASTSTTAATAPAPAPQPTSRKRLLAECFYNKHVTPGHAAIIIALQILKRENSVKLAVFTEQGLETVKIERGSASIVQAEELLKRADLGRVQQDAPMQWAARANQKVDVFINMIDRATRYMELDLAARGGRGRGARYGPPPPPERKLADHCPVRALERYRQSAQLPNSKLIVMSLASHRVWTTDGSHEGVLDVVGVDEHVPAVLDAFARGSFK